MYNQRLYLIELIWWIITFVLIAVVMLPIFSNAPNFPMIRFNIVYIVIAFTYTRWIFGLKYTPYARIIVLKIAIILASAISLLLLQDGLAELQVLWDDGNFDLFLSHLNEDKKISMTRYIKSEFYFFGVSSLICAILLPISLLRSIWRQKNKGTV